MPVKLVFKLLTLNGSQENYSSIYKEFCGSHEEIASECTIYYTVLWKSNYFSKSLKVILSQDYSMRGKSPERKLISNLISKFTMFMSLQGHTARHAKSGNTAWSTARKMIGVGSK